MRSGYINRSHATLAVNAVSKTMRVVAETLREVALKDREDLLQPSDDSFFRPNMKLRELFKATSRRQP